MDAWEKNKDWNKMVRYLKNICKHYPKEYYLLAVLSEYCKMIDDKQGCLLYAQTAFDQESNDPLVRYNYAEALRVNRHLEDALRQFEELAALGLDYMAFSEHGEGMRWAKKLMRDTKNNIIKIKQYQIT